MAPQAPLAPKPDKDVDPNQSNVDPERCFMNLDVLPQLIEALTKLIGALPKLIEVWETPLVQSLVWGGFLGVCIALREDERRRWRMACADAHDALSKERDGFPGYSLGSHQRLLLLDVANRRQRRRLKATLAEYDSGRDDPTARTAAIDRLLRLLED